MLNRFIVICCYFVLLVATADRAVANDKNAKYIITMKPLGQTSGSLQHLSEWQATLRGASIVLHWSCGAFQAVDSDASHCDSVMTIDVLSSRGQINVSPTRDSDQTNCDVNDDEAHVSTSITGFGAVIMNLQLELVSPFPAAGEYLNTVELSVTAN